MRPESPACFLPRSGRFLARLIDAEPPGLDDDRLEEPLRSIRTGAVVSILAVYALGFRREPTQDAGLRLAILEDFRDALCFGERRHRVCFHEFVPEDEWGFFLEGVTYHSATSACYAIPQKALWKAWRVGGEATLRPQLRDQGLEHIDLRRIADAWGKRMRRGFRDLVDWHDWGEPLRNLVHTVTWEARNAQEQREKVKATPGRVPAPPGKDNWGEGEILAGILEHREKSQEEIAGALGISRSTLERLAKKHPSIKAALKARRGDRRERPHGFRTDNGDVDEVYDREEED